MIFHNSNYGHFRHFDYYCQSCPGYEYDQYGCLFKEEQKCRSDTKLFVNWSISLKVIVKTKKFADFLAISFVFWANISTGLWGPFGCSDFYQIFFGGSPTVIEWDKIVTEIIQFISFARYIGILA